jgi:hypothetical protein
METDTQPSGPETGFQSGPEPDTDGGDEGEGGGETEPAQQQPTGAQPPAGTQPPRESRQQRRDRFNETLELRKALQAMTDVHRENQTRHERELALLRQSIEAGRPPKPDPIAEKRKALNDRYEKVVARLDKDPSAGQEFRELMAEYGRLGAEEVAAQQPARQQASQPDAILQRIVGEFPWLDGDSGDRAAIAMANGHVARLVKQEKRDMRDPQVRYTTLRQGAALAAKDFGYPVGTDFPAANGKDRVAGTSGRGAAPGGGGPADFAGMDADIEAAAKIMYPNDEPAAAVKKWKSNAGRHLASFRK